MSETNEIYEGCGEDAAPYVLGALSDAEHVAFLAHLQTCASCREEVAGLQVVANALPAAVPQRTAPASLRGRVLATVQAEAELRNASARQRRPGRRTARGRLTLPLAFGSLAATAAVVVLALIVLGGSSGGGTRVIRAEVSAPAASATLSVSSDHGTLKMARIPKTAPGRVYEVWIKRAGSPRPTDALFTVSREGTATVGVPGDLKGATAVMVTAEPDGGSPVPTSAPVIVAKLS